MRLFQLTRHLIRGVQDGQDRPFLLLRPDLEDISLDGLVEVISLLGVGRSWLVRAKTGAAQVVLCSGQDSTTDHGLEVGPQGPGLMDVQDSRGRFAGLPHEARRSCPGTA